MKKKKSCFYTHVLEQFVPLCQESKQQCLVPHTAVPVIDGKWSFVVDWPKPASQERHDVPLHWSK